MVFWKCTDLFIAVILDNIESLQFWIQNIALYGKMHVFFASLKGSNKFIILHLNGRVWNDLNIYSWHWIEMSYVLLICRRQIQLKKSVKRIIAVLTIVPLRFNCEKGWEICETDSNTQTGHLMDTYIFFRPNPIWLPFLFTINMFMYLTDFNRIFICLQCVVFCCYLKLGQQIYPN